MAKTISIGLDFTKEKHKTQNKKKLCLKSIFETFFQPVLSL